MSSVPLTACPALHGLLIIKLDVVRNYIVYNFLFDPDICILLVKKTKLWTPVKYLFGYSLK